MVVPIPATEFQLPQVLESLGRDTSTVVTTAVHRPQTSPQSE